MKTGSFRFRLLLGTRSCLASHFWLRPENDTVVEKYVGDLVEGPKGLAMGYGAPFPAGPSTGLHLLWASSVPQQSGWLAGIFGTGKRP